jgi:hypothetical protein
MVMQAIICGHGDDDAREEGKVMTEVKTRYEKCDRCGDDRQTINHMWFVAMAIASEDGKAMAEVKRTSTYHMPAWRWCK